MMQDIACRALDAYRAWAERDAGEHPGGHPLAAAAIIAACVVLTGAMEAV